MSTNPIAQQPKPKKRNTWFKESTWVTIGWNWITTFVSRGAEPILLICFLIQLYSVLPDATKILPSVMNTVFIVQSMTLDIAGIGLIMMCHRLKMDKSSAPMKLGKWLLGIMIVSLVFAIIKSHTSDYPIYPYIEGGLLIVRAVLAVIYSPVMHTVNGQIKTLEDEKTIDQQIQERLSKAVEAEIKTLADRLTEMQKGFQSLSMLPAKLTEIESQIGQDRAEIESQMETNLKALKAFIERQTERPRVTVSEVPGPAAPKKAPIPIAARAQATSHLSTGQSKRDFVERCLQEDATMSISEIQRRAEKAGLPMSTGTVSTYRKAFNEGETESDVEGAG